MRVVYYTERQCGCNTLARMQEPSMLPARSIVQHRLKVTYMLVRETAIVIYKYSLSFVPNSKFL